MKVHSQILLVLLIGMITISIPSCAEEIGEDKHPLASSSASETSKTEQAALKNSAVIIDSIEFYPTTGYLHPDSGNHSAWYSELRFFGRVKGDFANLKNEEMINQLKQKYQIPSIVSKNEQVFSVASADWQASGDDKESREIQLTVTCKEKIKEKTIITGINMEEDDILMEAYVGEYHIQPIEYTETSNCYLFENINDLMDTASENMVLTYRVAVLSKYPDSIAFQAVVAEDSSVLSGEAVSWRYDKQTTDDAKENYLSTKTAVDLENFKIYAVDVRVKTSLKSAVIQPYIIASYEGNSYSCISEPIYFDLNQSHRS